MIEELVARVFAARDCAHRAHWKTGSYAQHQALGAFYDGVIDAVDELVECYQGEFGLIGDFDVQTEAVADMVVYLEAEMFWIQSNRVAISRGSTSVQNLTDSLIAVYQRTLYKLVNLA